MPCCPLARKVTHFTVSGLRRYSALQNRLHLANSSKIFRTGRIVHLSRYFIEIPSWNDWCAILVYFPGTRSRPLYVQLPTMTIAHSREFYWQSGESADPLQASGNRCEISDTSTSPCHHHTWCHAIISPCGTCSSKPWLQNSSPHSKMFSEVVVQRAQEGLTKATLRPRPCCRQHNPKV